MIAERLTAAPKRRSAMLAARSIAIEEDGWIAPDIAAGMNTDNVSKARKGAQSACY
jgi:hypothetical protein